jgi:hypothetical protein
VGNADVNEQLLCTGGVGSRMLSARNPSGRVRLAAFIALLAIPAIVGAAWIGFRRPVMPVVLLAAPYRMPMSFVDRMERVVPTSPGWDWFWRLEQRIRGMGKPVNLFGQVIALPRETISGANSLGVGPPELDATNGLQVWILRAEQLQSLSRTLKQFAGAEVMSRPRVSTGSLVESSLFTGQPLVIGGVKTDVGISARYYPRVQADRLDLVAIVSFTEAVTNLAAAVEDQLQVRTNLHVGLRVQLPKGSGLFLLQHSFDPAEGRTYGLLLDPP